MNTTGLITGGIGTALLCIVLSTSTTTAATIYETGVLGTTGFSVDELSEPFPSPGSVGVNVLVPYSQVGTINFLGARFELTHPAYTSRVGGHFVGLETGDSIFAAIVALSDEFDTPNSFDLSSHDVLGSTVIVLPTESEEVFGELELSLSPGWYALIFGGTLFGAEGASVALQNNPTIGTPSFFGRPSLLPSPNGWADASLDNLRFVIEGTLVPEPTTFVLLTCGMLTLPSCRKRSRQGA